MSFNLGITTPVSVKDGDGTETTSTQWTSEGDSKEFKLQLQKSSSTGKTTKDYHDACYMSLVSFTFNKQMYSPCEIHARMEVYTYTTKQNGEQEKTKKTIDQKELDYNFKGGTVTFDAGSSSCIASEYYVYRLNTQTSGAAFYVDFIIYSPDKKLTTEISSRTFVSKRLFADIATNEAKNKVDLSRNPQNALKYGTGTDDYIQPYLVQYNESFYDLLVRTANRWGEFVYFEGGNLHLGLNTSSATLGDTYTTYKYADDELADKTNKDQVSQDDYLGVIKKDTFIQRAGDCFARDPIYSHKVMQNFLNMKGNVWDWLADIGIKDTTTAGHNTEYLKHQKDKYNEAYFDHPFYSDYSDSDKSKWTPYDGDDLTRIKLQYKFKDNDSTDVDKAEEYCQFSNYLTDATKGLCSTVYQKVLKYEKEAAQNMICVDYGTTYQHILLGQKISVDSADYIVTKVECTEDISYEVGPGAKKGEYVLTEKPKLHFRYYAVKQTTGGFYPPMLPSGHIRTSGPQIAKIADKFDPLMKVRYRVKYDWPTETSTEASPWIPVTHEMLSTGSGSVWMMEEGSLVLLNFTEGNIERPYIVGAFQTPETSVPRATQFNTMNLQTPSGQAIRLTDGYGGGAANFVASFLPIASFFKGFWPEKNGVADFGGYNKCYEGGVELTDYFGIYSIKASTDERNISIKSPYGDVNLNAFTGITISAPNGDVKIQGKNVSIEAGNNVSITSGKNIEQGILGHGLLMGRNWSGQTAWLDIGKAIANSALDFMDMSIVRHAIEVVLRPIAGEMKISSNRMMTIQAGVKKSDYESNYEKKDWDKIKDWWDYTVLQKNELNAVFGLRNSDSWGNHEDNGKIVIRSKRYDQNTYAEDTLGTDYTDKVRYKEPTVAQGGAVAGVFYVYDRVLEPPRTWLVNKWAGLCNFVNGLFRGNNGVLDAALLEEDNPNNHHEENQEQQNNPDENQQPANNLNNPIPNVQEGSDNSDNVIADGFFDEEGFF